MNSLEWFTFCPFIIPCTIERKDYWGTRSALIFRLKLILTPTWVGTACKAIPWSLLDGSMWIGIIFNFSYRTGTNLSMKHSVFMSVTGLWTKYIKLMTQNVIYHHQNPIHMSNMLKLVFESDTFHAWNRSGNHNMTLCRINFYLIILAMNILDSSCNFPCSIRTDTDKTKKKYNNRLQKWQPPKDKKKSNSENIENFKCVLQNDSVIMLCI